VSLIFDESFINMEIRWKTSARASLLHAAEAISLGQPLADGRLENALRPAAPLLARSIDAASLPPARLWRHLLPLSAVEQEKRHIVELALTKTLGRGKRFDQAVAELTAALAAIESAGSEALPGLEAELALRERPLREQWEARGPGLLRILAALIEDRLLPDHASVVLVHPALGGAGQAFLPYNQVQIEGVLANPIAELPETVRLAWLVAQLQLDLPAFSEAIHADRLPHIARFALLPPVLAAAQGVELAANNSDTLALAIRAWRLTVPAGVDAAALLAAWWQGYQESRPAWPVALAALDQMFG
jgi:hypothetical protein